MNKFLLLLTPFLGIFGHVDTMFGIEAQNRRKTRKTEIFQTFAFLSFPG